ncbi:Alpha-2,8-sialyltransferase 8E [Labeo rohita]|uniref:Alpha-2,8-sialyltransferase 8E n=1 Tax=Labeo rohita TaxID=84645 RepID=A0ABQ8LH85_LABRO|nr:Alpha-2,8-sialyltransferase 8E [Labeo rohita]
MDLLKWIFSFLIVLVIFTCLYLSCGKHEMMRIDMKNYTDSLSPLMSCPHVSNRTQKELIRSKLHLCCNATGLLYLTKKNTAVNQTITYETSNSVYKVGAALHKMLPEDFPWSSRGHLGRCAVVGNGGILKNSSCGREIDSADFIISYSNMDVNPGPLVQRVSVYGNASLIIPAFAYTVCTAVSIKTLQLLQPIRPQQPVVFFSPYYLKSLDRFWKGRGLKEERLSTGFMLVNVALELCDDVHLYGFWPFDFNLKQQALQHHYYDNKPPKPLVHAMPEEFIKTACYVFILCCNATGLLYLTKKNTAVNQTITYETSKCTKWKLHFTKCYLSSCGHLGQCAVVGIGEILKNSSCGREIDSAEFVIRYILHYS